MAEMKVSVKITGTEPFKSFLIKLDRHINDYVQNFADASEVMPFIVREYSNFMEIISDDKEGENV